MSGRYYFMSPWQKPSHSGCHSCKGVWEIDGRLFNYLLETGSCYIAHVGTESEFCLSLLSTQIMGLGHYACLSFGFCFSITGRTQEGIGRIRQYVPGTLQLGTAAQVYPDGRKHRQPMHTPDQKWSAGSNPAAK